jgi:hypothetical protein
MFNVLISGIGNAWETDQLMRMDLERFKEYSPGAEAQQVEANNPDALRSLESVPALLLYEECMQSAATDEVRYGRLHGIRLEGRDLVFRFNEEGRFSRAVFREFATRLGVTHSFEHNRTHWAIKDGGIPRDMMSQLVKTYDVAFSFAGANRDYVEQVANLLAGRGVRVFYDTYETAALWGEHLGEFLADVYERRARYCVMFISRPYAEREWTRHERRAALDLAIRDRRTYILPCRFDDTILPGISPSLSYIPLTNVPPTALSDLILTKLGM